MACTLCPTPRSGLLPPQPVLTQASPPPIHISLLYNSFRFHTGVWPCRLLLGPGQGTTTTVPPPTATITQHFQWLSPVHACMYAPQPRASAQLLQQLNAARAQLHDAAYAQPRGRRLEVVDRAVQRCVRQEVRRRLKAHLEHRRHAALDADAVAGAVAALYNAHEGRGACARVGGTCACVGVRWGIGLGEVLTYITTHMQAPRTTGPHRGGGRSKQPQWPSACRLAAQSITPARHRGHTPAPSQPGPTW